MSFRPPSYDPCSPSYDPAAASPCNPFPTSSPFATFAFSPPRSAHSSRSAVVFEMDISDFEPTSQPSPQPIQLAALARIPPPHSAPALRRTKPCRFYLSAAGCKSGRWCNFKHPVDIGAGPDGETNSGSIEALRAAVARSRGDPDDVAMWEHIPDVRDVDPNWGKKSDDEVHPKFRTQPCRNYLLGLCRYGSRCQFIHAPGLFAPGAAEMPTSLPIPAAPVPIPVSVWGAHPGVGASPSETGPGGKPEQMSLFYRTKLCKFFNATGTCPHGPDCKFIHDPKKAPPITMSPSAPSWADDDRELDFAEAPLFAGPSCETSMTDNGAMHDVTNSADRTRRRRSNAEREREKERESGIYKPLWRVVGGGVKVGNPADAHMRWAEPDDDAVFEYQPHDTTGAPPRRTFSPPTTNLSSTSASPLEFTYTPFDLAQYPPHMLLRPPSPSDMPLEITMGRLESRSAGPARKRRVVTGADLMRGLGGDREREKPRLTIAVPSPVMVQSAAGDDMTDWTEEEKGAPRRVRSTPPTPRSSASYLDVPVLPRMFAESP